MVHAGIPPFWDLPTLLRRANEVESVLSGTAFERFLTDMYGNEPSKWKDELTGNTRLRVITNYLTRLRYCDTDGTLELKHKASKRPQGFEPWFNIQRTTAMKIVFGHWAALDGVTNQPNIVALDTGCVWGRKLTAMRLEDRQIFSTPARKTYQL
jgi:bis(5'-nucleosyl)-tetraphosphatase (symmetrical)